MSSTCWGPSVLAGQALQGACRKSSRTGTGSQRSAARRRARWCPLPAFAAAAPEQNVRRADQHWQVAPSLHAGAAPAAAAAAASLASNAPVLVGVLVPNCRLQPGEQLRLVGSSPELGGWDPAAAVQLVCDTCGDCWSAEVALPPGTHHAKLVIARERDGSVCCWEGGADRVLRVPHMGGMSPAAGPALTAKCLFGNTASTTLKVGPGVDCQQLKAAALAAANRAVELAERKEQLAARLDHLVHEVEDSEARIANKRSELQQMLASELAHLKSRGVVSAQVARLEGRQAEGSSAAEVAGSKSGPAQQQGQQGQAAAAAPSLPQGTAQRVGVVHRSSAPAASSSGSDGSSSDSSCLEFSFLGDSSDDEAQGKREGAPRQAAAVGPPQGSAGSGEGKKAGTSSEGKRQRQRGPSAFELAKERLLHLLPAEAEVQLEQRWRREQRQQQRQQREEEQQRRQREEEQQRQQEEQQRRQREEEQRRRMLAQQHEDAATAAAAVNNAAGRVSTAKAVQLQQEGEREQRPAAPILPAAAATSSAPSEPATATIPPANPALTAADPAAVPAPVAAAAPAPAPVAARSPAAVPVPAASAAGMTQPVQRRRRQQQRACSKLVPAAQRSPAAAPDLLKRGNLPVVATIVVGQQVWKAYRTLWDVLASSSLPGAAALRSPAADIVFSLAFVAAASAPLWN